MIFLHLSFATRCWSLARCLTAAALLVAAPAVLAKKPEETSHQKSGQAEKKIKGAKPEKALKAARVSSFVKPAKSARVIKRRKQVSTENIDGVAEAGLMEVYRLVGSGQARSALDKAQALVTNYPNFQLAQLVYGDLLTNRIKPVKTLGDVPADLAISGSVNLQELRAESRLRTNAVKDRPPAGMVPPQFLSLSRINKHAIAVDVSKARLYLFENSEGGLKLLADYYISVGKAGTGKLLEGDQRTPLGLYFVTSNLDPNILKDLYGAGALPVNYPNALDIRRGKTGGGIWLHGTPSNQFTRAPLATDGCVAVSNPDLERILRTVEIRTTPVLIAKSLNWVPPASLAADKLVFAAVLQAWTQAKSQADPALAMRFYASDFSADDKTIAAQAARLQPGKKSEAAHAIELHDVSFMRWTDEAEIMIATFGEVTAGIKGGKIIRQYWQRRSGQWQIIYEAVIG